MKWLRETDPSYGLGPGVEVVDLTNDIEMRERDWERKYHQRHFGNKSAQERTWAEVAGMGDRNAGG